MKATTARTCYLSTILFLAASCSKPATLGTSLTPPVVSTPTHFEGPSPLPDLVALEEPTDRDIMYEGSNMVSYSHELIVGISVPPPLKSSTREVYWRMSEKEDWNSAWIKKHGQAFEVPFDFVSGGSILGDDICVVGMDEDDNLIVESWRRRPRLGGRIAGHYGYPAGPNGFEAEFTTPEKIEGGGPFILPTERKGAMRTERKRILKQKLGVLPLNLTAYPDGRNFYVLAKDLDSPRKVLLHILSEPSKTTVTTVADSETYPWMIHATMIEIPIFVRGEIGYPVVMTASPTYGPERQVAMHLECLCFEDRDADGRFEGAVLYADEGEFLQSEGGDSALMLTRCGPLFSR